MYSEPFRIGTGEAILASSGIIALIPLFLISAPWWTYAVVIIAIAIAFLAGRIDGKAEVRDPRNFRNGIDYRPLTKKHQSKPSKR